MAKLWRIPGIISAQVSCQWLLRYTWPRRMRMNAATLKQQAHELIDHLPAVERWEDWCATSRSVLPLSRALQMQGEGELSRAMMSCAGLKAGALRTSCSRRPLGCEAQIHLRGAL